MPMLGLSRKTTSQGEFLGPGIPDFLLSDSSASRGTPGCCGLESM